MKYLFYFLIISASQFTIRLFAQDIGYPQYRDLADQPRDISPLDQGFIISTQNKAEDVKSESKWQKLFGDIQTHSSVYIVTGWGYDDAVYNNDTKSGMLSMLRFEHTNTWRYGDNYLYADFTYGDRVNFRGQPTRNHNFHSEYLSRFSFSKMTGKESQIPMVSDLSLAMQFEANTDQYHAYLVGLSLDLNPPAIGDLQFSYLKTGLFFRDDAFNRGTCQWGTSWAIPCSLWNERFLFDGFVDLAGTDENGLDLDGRIRLLLDITNHIGIEDLKETASLEAGFELYFHRNSRVDTYAPGIVFKGSI